MKISKPLSWIFRFFPIMAFCFFIAGLPIKAGAYYIVNIPVTMTVDYNNSMKAIDLFNDARIEMGLEPLTVDSKLMDEALQRAAEISCWYSHSRPAGTMATYEITAYQENIAFSNTSNAQAFFNSVKGSSSHWVNVKYADYKSTAIAIVDSGSGIFQVQLFDQKEGDGKGMSSGIVNVNRTVEFTNGNLTNNFCKGRITNITYGQPNTDPIRIIARLSGGLDLSTGYPLPDGMYTCSSSDTSIFTVDNKGTVYPKKVGTANMTVTLKDHPDISATFPITVDPLDVCTGVKNPIEADAYGYMYNSFNYTGSAITPKLTLVNNSGGSLIENVDYILSYGNNIQPGINTAWVRCTGIGNYTGQFGIYFSIKNGNVSTGDGTLGTTGNNPSTPTTGGSTGSGSSGGTGGSSTGGSLGGNTVVSGNKGTAKITLSKSVYAYTGKARKPSVKVVLNGLLLKPGEYSVTYKNNVKPGLATVTVKGKGMYASTVPAQKLNFVIVPKKMGTPAVKASGSGKLKVSWKKDKLASGYQIQASTSKKFKSGVKSYTCKVSASSKTLKLSKKKTYYVRIRAYKTVNGTKKYGAWSKVKKIKTK